MTVIVKVGFVPDGMFIGTGTNPESTPMGVVPSGPTRCEHGVAKDDCVME